VWRLTALGYEELSGESTAKETDRINVARTPDRRKIELISDAEESSFPEGAEAYKLHRHLERNCRIVDLAKQHQLVETGRLECEVCHVDFNKVYVDVGEGFIEAHHLTPVSELGGKVKTRLSDLVLVCSNCHRMLHRRRPWLSRGELKEILKKQGR
jgi:putative restriction endonuclease